MRVIIFWLSILATFITLSFLKFDFFIIGVIIMMIIYLVDILGKDNNNSIGLSLIPYKKVYTEWGTFYIKLKDTLPDFIQVGKYKIATLESILSEKLNLIESCMKSGYTISIENKHILDCNSIVSKIQAYAK